MQTLLRRAGRVVLVRLVLALMLVGGLVVIPGGTASAGAEKVDVCHSEGNGNFHLINVAEQAYQKHVDHGDAAPGDPVAGMDGYAFTDDCTLIAANTAPVAGNIAANFVPGSGCEYKLLLPTGHLSMSSLSAGARNWFSPNSQRLRRWT